MFASAFLIPQQKGRSLVDDSTWDDERWFSHAENLLRGRYSFPRKLAAETLRKATGHRKLSGDTASAAEQFGNIELFVAQLASAASPPLMRSMILKRLAISAGLIFYGTAMLIPDLTEDGIGVLAVLKAAAWIGLVVWCVMSWRPKRIAADIQERQASRHTDASSLSAHQADD
ncbi:hypothetical protein [Paeniglutamicibacter kerguelensis]|uniref:Uncharacterized protein n=1 Tax=Paeniglutamicibacter kerguelensis TaxID=254788 RepID=A0ABS4XCB2_9MICC|nr:hypothetical protein [Paeniglutamicibacter kerguelensis]MBP2386112.1 hypothetical protein [Paeniglutamicibacter kerguelensis]